MTNHTYWNLSGDFKEKKIEKHDLFLQSSSYCVLDEQLLGTGEVESVESRSEFDFRMKGGHNRIGDLGRLDGQVKGGGQNGIDHPFLIEREGAEQCQWDAELIRVAELHSTTRQLHLYSNQPAIVLYTANFLPQD